MNTEDSNTQIQRYDSFDGLRAFAALCIVMMHVRANMMCKPEGLFIYSIIASFSSFVYLFMMLSAFSLCCGYYHKLLCKNGDCRFNVDSFYNKRYSRIWPFFFILVIIECVKDCSLESLYESFADLTLVFHLLPNPSLNVVGMGWFLGVIFLFYIMFPFFCYLLNNKKRAWFALLVSIVFQIIGYNYFLVDSSLVLAPIFKRQIIFCLPYFMVGGILYIYRESLLSFALKNKTLIGIVAFLAFILYYTPFCPVIFGDEYLYLALVFALFILYAMADSATNDCSNTILRNNVTKLLSNISMEVYLCHMMMFRIVEKVHIERYIENEHISFVFHYVATLSIAILFSLMIKTSFKYIGSRIPSLSFLK